MATLKEILDFVNATKTNQLDDYIKTKWVNRIERRIQHELQGVALDSPDLAEYDWDVDQDTVLRIPSPYDEIYTYYLYAMIDFTYEEFELYQNDLSMFNSIYEQYGGELMNTDANGNLHTEIPPLEVM